MDIYLPKQLNLKKGKLKIKKKYLVAGFRKGEKESTLYTLNANIYDEQNLRKTFHWVEVEEANNNMRFGSINPTKLSSIDDIIKWTDKFKPENGFHCENDYFCYIFKPVKL